jgi:hypothetical protein
MGTIGCLPAFCSADGQRRTRLAAPTGVNAARDGEVASWCWRHCKRDRLVLQ